MTNFKKIMQPYLDAIAMDVPNSDSFAQLQADKHNAKVAEMAQKVYDAYISRGESVEVAEGRKAAYIKTNGLTYINFK